MSTEQTTDAAEAVRYERGDDGIVTLVLDDPTSSANTMNAAFAKSLASAVEQLVQDSQPAHDPITGVIITSAKKTFFAGGDLRAMIKATPADAPAIFAEVEGIKRSLRQLETLGVPVVAALNGAALGGGLEIALACHHRVAVDDGRSEFGLPEVTLGLLPGGGGVARTVRMLGLQDALMNVLLQGPRMKPARAKDAGLIDELVAGQDELLPAARTWLTANVANADAATQPWDRKDYRMPGGTPSSPKLAQFLPAFASNLRKQLKGAPYPAPRNIMSAAVEGAQVDFDTATRIESRYFVELITGQTFKNMTQAFFFDLTAINAGGSRPAGVAPTKASRLAVLGAGMMGAGIAYVSAQAGIDVVLKDVDLAAAQKGKDYSATLLDRQVAKGRLSADRRDAVLARITPTADYADLAGCDFVIEAVFESVTLKQQVFGDLEPVINADALLGSNTSTLPITILAGGVQRPEDFIGIHFFSPVDKMPLVEIIVGAKTSNAAIARAIDYTKQIGKTPIVVNDSRGFFTSRVFGTLVMEGAQMLGEGLNPVAIERAATTTGFPAPPLAMIDEVSLTLPQKISAEAKGAADAAGKTFPDSAAMDVVNKMVELGRKGKAAGAGFYEYPAAGPDGRPGKKYLWPGLTENFADTGREIPFRDMQERLTFIMSLETVRCLDEGVLRTVADANIGSIFGIGFPPCYGGALQYINGYEAADGSIGIQAFTERAQELAARYGERFTPPALLLTKAAANERFR